MLKNKEQISGKDLRVFGFTIGSITALLFGLALPFIFDRTIPLWPWIIGGLFIIAGGLFPKSLRYIHNIWMKIGSILGWINTRIILGLIFFLVMTPIGLILSMTARDAMSRKIDHSQATYRILSVIRKKNHVERPF